MSDPMTELLLTGLLERVGEAAAAALARIDAAEEEAVAAGAGAVEAVALCEVIVRMAQACQTDAVADLDVRRREVLGPHTDEREVCRSLFAEIGLARQASATAGESTYRLTRDLEHHPAARRLLQDGVVNQSVVAAVCRETVYLAPDQRAEVDAELAPFLAVLGPRRAAAAARRLVIEKDPHAAFVRTVRARDERHVRLRPELDAMATLSICAPAAQLAPVWERLDHEASARHSDGDPRTIAQLTSDLAVERLAGASVTADGALAIVTEIGVLMRPETLYGTDDVAAVLRGYGPVPGELARRLASGEQGWVRRFFTRPDGHGLEAVDPRRRRFPAGVARLVRATDELCARPWCECRVREIDHTTPYARGGETVLDNAQGVCRTDNLLKETRGWRVDRDHARSLTWTTPTGRRYVSAGAVGGPVRPFGPGEDRWSPMEDRLRHLVTVSRT
ncbi:HNH endonuclease signature motif containing protein [Mumia sp.]|uniref:HNH endonuclease signature motif containing protein n=1 Tax=Mumia sp. TaxID=1965300 RepID=UPI002627EE08|nr:HNH endonuclease signature motif containing protein [Mumia sp.]MDD9349081.1 hypothetical protein [Mumia sp.]